MASKQFLAALKATEQVKDLDSLLVANTNFLGKGKHDVKITAVDTTEVSTDNPFINVTYENEDGQSHNERVYLVGKDGSLHFSIRQLMAGLAQSGEFLHDFLVTAGADDKLWGALVGMTIRINLGFRHTEGVFRVGSQDGKRVAVQPITEEVLYAVNPETQEEWVDGKEMSEVLERVAGLKRAYLNITAMECIDADGNREILSIAKGQPTSTAIASDPSAAVSTGSKGAAGRLI